MSPQFNLTEVPASTAYQREQIVRWFSKNELQTRKTTLLHRIPFRAANLADPEPDQPMAPLLDALSFAQASALINALKRQAGAEISDDDDDL